VDINAPRKGPKPKRWPPQLRRRASRLAPANRKKLNTKQLLEKKSGDLQRPGDAMRRRIFTDGCVCSDTEFVSIGW
jgi:hypothetical protein